MTLESGFSTRRLTSRTPHGPVSKPCFNTRNVLFHGRGPGSAWDLCIMLNCCCRTKLPVSTGTDYLSGTGATAVFCVENATMNSRCMLDIWEVSGTHWRASPLASLNTLHIWLQHRIAKAEPTLLWLWSSAHVVGELAKSFGDLKINSLAVTVHELLKRLSVWNTTAMHIFTAAGHWCRGKTTTKVVASFDKSSATCSEELFSTITIHKKGKRNLCSL